MRQPATPRQLERAQQNIQANLVRAGKYKSGDGRDWSLFFFFRIMTDDEFRLTLEHAGEMMAKPDVASLQQVVLLDLEQPSRAWSRRWGWPSEQGRVLSDTARPQEGRDEKAGTSSVQAEPTPAAPTTQPATADDGGPKPASAFLDWLQVLASADKTALAKQAQSIADQLAGPAPTDGADADMAATFHSLLSALRSPGTLQHLARRSVDPTAVGKFLRAYARVLNDPDLYRQTMRRFGRTPQEAGATALQDSLCGVTFYELLRQAAPAFLKSGSSRDGIIRGEQLRRVEKLHRLDGKGVYDPLPVNLAFTFQGLRALQLDETTLASFPDPFKQGMAARAARLNDTGPSAPANWESEYGLRSVHGFFTGGFPAGDKDRPVKETLWRNLRKDITAFNDRRSETGRALRAVLGLLFRQLGLEILRIELGQDPYRVDEKTGDAVALPEREEHFGYRDGISQPFADLGLRDPPAGGGTPNTDGTWSPVAPGEIYLDLPDEDGEVQQLPVAPELRRGSTYIVFRKLEQDVAGFRAFLEQQRPEPDDQERLAAQLLGRWRNGTPLVLSPVVARDADNPAHLNNFRYAKDDLYGQKCPLGAHIRRANPRDTGGRAEVKRHRILRRGVSYGGPVLAADSLGDGEARGLLFIAVNSRIDLQFEVVQADWINGGEFLGQAGLGRCPVVGNHDGGPEDSFLESGAVAPIAGIPRFVTTRGGEYFYAPGLTALRRLAVGYKFAMPRARLPFLGAAMGAAVTPALFDPDRLQRYGAQMLAAEPGPDTVVRVQLPLETGASKAQVVVFVGRHADVTRVLQDHPSSGGPGDPEGKPRPAEPADAQGKCPVGPEWPVEFSIKEYQLTGRRITRGYDFLIGMEPEEPTKDARAERYWMLCKAWRRLEAATPGGTQRAIGELAAKQLTAARKRTLPVGRIDLVHDLAVQAAYAVVTELLGVQGPDFLTELAPALPFGSQHIASLPPDWLAAAKGAQPADPGLATMQIWSVLMLADMLGNMQSDHEARPFSRQAGSEMLSQIDAVFEGLATPLPPPRRPPPPTLAGMFVEDAKLAANPDDYLRKAAVVLMELVSDTLAAVPATFGHVMSFLLENRIDVRRLMPALRQQQGAMSGVDRLIYEAERLNPILPVLLRKCETDTPLPGGGAIKAGDMVAAVVQIADLDPLVFTKPKAFSLDPYIPGPPRDPTKYLAFGAAGPHQCWGRDLVAMPLLRACVAAVAEFEGLDQIAGAAGQVQSLVGVTIGLPARFTQAA